MELAQHPAVVGSGKRASLFWFAISPLFTGANGDSGEVAHYLHHPEVAFERLWALPDHTLHALCDEDNFTDSRRYS